MSRLFWLIEKTPRTSAAVAIAVGILVLFGWAFDLPQFKNVFSELVAVKMNTALGLILAGISLWNASALAPQRSPLSRIVAQVCAASVLLLGLLTVGEYLGGRDFGIDQLVMRDVTTLSGDISERMAVSTAASFIILGAALVLLSQKRGGFTRSIHALTIGLILIAGSSLISYAYNIEEFLRAKLSYNPMAIHTSMVLVLFSLGILNARPDYPFRRIITSDSAAGSTARRLWSASMILQLVMGWLLLRGIQTGYFSEAVGLALFVSANIVGLSALIYWSTAQLYLGEKALQSSEKRYRNLLNSLQEGIWAIDTDICTTFVNPRMAEMLGYSVKEMLGKPLFPFLDEHAREVLLHHIERCRHGIKEQYELEFLRKDGTRIYTSIMAAPIYDEQGNYAGSLAGITDITAHKHAEQALRESEEKFRTISNFAQDAILMMDNDGAISYWNPAAEKIFGYPEEQALGKPLHRLLALERYFENYSKGFSHFRTTGEGPVIGKTQELMAKRNTGEEFPIELSLSAIKLGNRWSAVGIIRDITERKRAEGQLRNARDQLELRVEERTLELAAANQALQEDVEARISAEEQLRKLNASLAQQVSIEVAKNREKDMLMIQQSRMAAMGEMIGNIAHQWRQPLSALAILLGVIKEAHEFGELTDEYLEQAIANGQRLIKKMSTTINDFRDFFRSDKEKTTFSVLAQINETIAIVEASFKNNNISLELIAERDLKLLGFPNEYSQVLLNLLSNAKDAIQTHNIAEGKIVIRLEQVGNFGRVSVTDNGGGIPTEILDKIFDPYFSTKTRGGTGIGLYMSKMIIERNMSGQLSARNTDGGAEFVIETPLADEVLSAKAAQGESL